MLFPRKCSIVLDDQDTSCLIPTQDPVKRNADLRRDANSEQVRHVNIKISLTISLILASPN